MLIFYLLISSENVACIYFFFHIVEACVVAVGDDGVTFRLELRQIVYHLTAEECGAVFKGWLVDDDLCTLCLDALHDALNGRLTEVVAV